MSKFTCTIHMYDSYDSIRYVVRVHDFARADRSDRIVMALVGDFLGVGESDPYTWLADNLLTLSRAARR